MMIFGKRPSMKRSKEEIILLLLCGLSIPSILPFGVIRLIQGNWWLGAVDLAIVTGMLCVIVYVLRTRRVRIAGIVVTIFYSIGMLTALSLRGPTIVYWAYPTMIAAFFILRAKEALAINSLSLLCMVWLLYKVMPLFDLACAIVTLTLINLFSTIFSHRTNLQHRELNQQASLDFLTGAGNRRAFDKRLTQLCANDVNQFGACLLLLDLDHFKKINDDFGHSVGDDVLIRVADLVRSRIRATDGLYRYGGEEFVVVTIGNQLDASAKFAEELRSLIANTPIFKGCLVTTSIGVAELRNKDTPNCWFQRADAALYEAKNSGRNCVKLAANQSH